MVETKKHPLKRGSDIKVEQPLIHPNNSNEVVKSRQGGLGVAKYRMGSKRSIIALENNNFDPITKLCDQYRKIEEEIRYYEDWRANKIVPISHNGRELMYTAKIADIHMRLHDSLISIGEKLLRYGYGRVPESNTDGSFKPVPLIIKPQDGSTITIKQNNTIEGDFEIEEDDDN